MDYYLPERAKAIIQSMGQKFPELRKGDDDQRRAFTMKAAQQIRYELGDRYGTKRADMNRPPSKDAIAFRPTDTTLVSWDVIDGTTREVSTGSKAEEIDGQVFIVVDPVNHLGAGVVDPVTPIVDPPPVSGGFESDVRISLGRVEGALGTNPPQDMNAVAHLAQTLTDLLTRVSALESKMKDATWTFKIGSQSATVRLRMPS